MDDPPGYTSDAPTPTPPNAGSATAFSPSIPQPDAPLSPSQTPPAPTSTSHQARAAVNKATLSNKESSRLTQPYLESYFAPLALAAKPSSSSPAVISSCNVEEREKAVVVRNKRDLEIYVTLPSADRRLFVDVHEDLASAYRGINALENAHTSGRNKKKVKHSHHGAGQQMAIEEDELCEKSDSEQAVMQTDQAAIAGHSAASTSSLSSAADARAPRSPGGTISVQTPSASLGPSSTAMQTTSTGSSQPGSSKRAKAASTKKGTEPTFNQVRLNVRIRPPQKGNAGQRSGASVSTLPKATIPPPKANDRFPIRILGSTRPLAPSHLRACFDLSVQGKTHISALIVLLYTRIQMGSDQERKGPAPSFELNAIRLWHLDEDRLVRLSGGTIASNGITHKSVLCYSIGKRTGKTYVNFYADASLVKEVKLSLELFRHWRTHNHCAKVEISKPAEAPHRQRVEYLVKTSATSSHPAGSTPVLEESLKREPFVAAFSADLVAEIDTSPSALDIALSKARAEHEARVADREARQALRQEEREREAARLESNGRKLQRRSSQPDTPSGLPRAGSELSTPHPNEDTRTLSPGECLTDSDWSSEGFVEGYLDEHGGFGDSCDEELAFKPNAAKVTMEQGILLCTQPCDTHSAASEELGPALNAGRASIPSVREGLAHIFNALDIPSSSQIPVIEDMEQTAKLFPYIAIAVTGYKDVAIAADLEASYKLHGDLDATYDISDIHQICILYKGIWKSEAAQWAQSCTRLDAVDWRKAALAGMLVGSAKASAPATTQNQLNENMGTAPEGQETASTVDSPLTRFKTYWTRTGHIRNRLCPACEDEYCSNSRRSDVCEDLECDGDDCRVGEEFYTNGGSMNNAYAAASSQPSESTPSDKQETVATVLVPGHRARIVQCMFLETF